MVARFPAVRSVLATSALCALAAAVVAQPTPGDPKSVADLRSPQEQNAELFKQLQRELLSLAQKLERGERPEDKERAKVIYAALDLSRKENVQSQFEKMVAGMRGGTGNLRDLDQLAGQDAQLQKALREILTVLMTDDETARLRAEVTSLEKYLKEVRALKRAQELIRGMTDARRGDTEKIAKDQRDLADRTRDLADRMAGNKKPDTPTNPAAQGAGEEARAEPKPEPKPGDPAAEAKGDTQEATSDAKEGDGAPEARPAGKDGPPPADGMKPGNERGKGDDPGAARDAGQPRDGADMGKPGSEAKPGDDMGKPGSEAKPGGDAGKPGNDPKKPNGDAGKPGGDAGKPGSEAKPGDNAGKPGSEAKPGGDAGKPGSDAKPGGDAGKPSAPQPPKPADDKGKGQGKGNDRPSAGEKGGEARDQGKPGDQQQANSKGGKQGPQGPPGQQGGPQGKQGQDDQQAQQDQKPQPPGRKQLQEAYPHQQGAEQDLKKNDRDNAAKKEDKAIEALAKAAEELEKRLKQLREEELLKLLANLEARVNRMLAMQIEVYEATRGIDAVVVKNGGTKTTAEIQKAQQQAQKEGEIVGEANKALKLLEAEGTAVAFASVLEEVRQDMSAVQRRLDSAYVDKDTQAIEENVIALLKEMSAALKKAQEDIQQQQQQQQQQQAQQQKPGNQRLIDLLAELRLIKALQVQVNTRTKMHGDKAGTEQANDPLVQAEVRQLAERQAKLQEMINKIATGENQ